MSVFLKLIKVFFMSAKSVLQLLERYKSVKADYAALLKAAAAAAEADRVEDAAFETTIGNLQDAVITAQDALAQYKAEDEAIEALIQAELNAAPEAPTDSEPPVEEVPAPVAE
jgi:hypothetical protein